MQNDAVINSPSFSALEILVEVTTSLALHLEAQSEVSAGREDASSFFSRLTLLAQRGLANAFLPPAGELGN